MDIVKYPRTQHVAGSRLQKGDEDLEVVPQSHLVDKYLVIEEKQDGANSGISFDSNGKLYLQSRGHFLHGGPRESQFTLFKQWAATFSEEWYCALGDRFVAYGEWMYKKHTVYYDNLPHFWMEFDILDKQASTHDNLIFLDSAERQKLLSNWVTYEPVKILWRGVWKKDMQFEDFLGKSHFKTPEWKDNLKNSVADRYWDFTWKHTDQSDLMEGLYIKWEDNGRVMGRYKYVRSDFISLLIDNDEHHENHPPVANRLASGTNIF